MNLYGGDQPLQENQRQCRIHQTVYIAMEETESGALTSCDPEEWLFRAGDSICFIMQLLTVSIQEHIEDQGKQEETTLLMLLAS